MSQSNQTRGTAPKKQHPWLVCILLLILAAVLAAVVLGPRLMRLARRGASAPEQREDDILIMSVLDTDAPLTQKDAVKEYPDGDTVYIPAGEHLAYDAETCTVFYDNLLSVHLMRYLSEQKLQQLAQLVDGEIVGRLQGSLDRVQIKVPAATLAELEQQADLLMEQEEVLYASIEYPVPLSPNSAEEDPWSADPANPEPARGDEAAPGGNDWWAEAIGAYTAWQYRENCVPIVMGILDAGFDLEHEELAGCLHMLPGHEENSPNDHGTHVAGIMAAQNNGVGIRGIADSAQIFCASLWPERDGQKASALSSSECIGIFKQMLDAGAQTINNSWGLHIQSETRYLEVLKANRRRAGERSSEIDRDIQEHGSEYYQWYWQSQANMARQEAEQEMTWIGQWLMGSDRAADFLIVQSAGNGLDNGGMGIDARMNGDFAAVDQEAYNGLNPNTRAKLEEEGVSYQDIKNHIIIVGAVSNKRDSMGQYEMSASSNYGDTVDLCAPGADIFSTVTREDDESRPSQNKGLLYANQSGTSMAAPMVTASAAYVWALHPSMSAEEVKTLLCSNAAAAAYGVGGGEGCTYPMLNVGLAAKLLMVGVEDAYQCTFVWEDEYGADSVSYQIPRIRLPGEEIERLNQEIYDETYPWITDAVEQFKAGSLDPYVSVDYSWTINGDILSLMIEDSTSSLWAPHRRVYNVSISQEKVLTREEVLAHYGMKLADYRQRTLEEMQKFVEENRSSFESTGRGTPVYNSPDDLNDSLLYLDEDGAVHAVLLGPSYTMGAVEFDFKICDQPA